MYPYRGLHPIDLHVSMCGDKKGKIAECMQKIPDFGPQSASDSWLTSSPKVRGIWQLRLRPVTLAGVSSFGINWSLMVFFKRVSRATLHQNSATTTWQGGRDLRWWGLANKIAICKTKIFAKLNWAEVCHVVVVLIVSLAKNDYSERGYINSIPLQQWMNMSPKFEIAAWFWK